MKLSKKIISLFLALIMSFSVCIPAVFAVETDEKDAAEEYSALLFDGGFPIISTEDFGKFLQIIGKLYYLLTGEEPDVSRFNITLDSYVTAISAEICKNTGLDLKLISENFPDINVIARHLGEKYEINTTEFREARYAKRDEYLANGNPMMASVCHAIGAFMSIIEVFEIYTVETEDPDVVKVMLHIEYEDGTKEEHDAGLIINKKTGICTNEDGTGMFGSGYNFSLNEMMVYTTVDCWMRNFGFCVTYDILANLMPISYHYLTRRFKFTYDDTEWMIQIWKGNYFISNGGEVGIYSRDPEKAVGTFYNCATEEQELNMSMQVYAGKKLIVNRPMQKHWWISGFHLSDKRYIPAVLTLKSSIEMPDEGMLKAFTDAIDRNLYRDVSYTVDGLTVSLVW
ncbi:MAG: DUF4474 domain-containing protein [Ruminococcaceae bacterium]|nr:DUF4474 domain-containing protein [Oscillospiraceae bacterium]MBR3598008.1 DUF4474 domain-containing protein [Clostridia bacterium]